MVKVRLKWDEAGNSVGECEVTKSGTLIPGIFEMSFYWKAGEIPLLTLHVYKDDEEGEGLLDRYEMPPREVELDVSDSTVEVVEHEGGTVDKVAGY